MDADGEVTQEASRAGELQRPALVVVDMQMAIDHPMWGPRNNPGAEAVIAALLAAWRAAGLPLFHVRHDSTEETSAFQPRLPTHAFKPEAMPLEGEPVIPKQTNSAFIGTDLAERLSDSNCHGVVYVGVITNNSLEATVRMSGNLGFDSYVVSDGCWTVDKVDLRGHRWPAEDVHALTLANLHGEYATVVESSEVVAAVAAVNG